MARRKSPNKIDTSATLLDVKDRLSWLEREYALLAQKRNMAAFLFNKALASMMPGERPSEKMREWQKEAWRIEYIMQWIQEAYHKENLRYMQQSKLTDAWGQDCGLEPGQAEQLGLGASQGGLSQ